MVLTLFDSDLELFDSDLELLICSFVNDINPDIISLHVRITTMNNNDANIATPKKIKKLIISNNIIYHIVRYFYTN